MQGRAIGLGPARALEKSLDRPRALEARRHRAAGAEFRAAEFVAPGGVVGQRDFQSIRRQGVGGALRPFDQRDGALDRLPPAQLGQLLGAA